MEGANNSMRRIKVLVAKPALDGHDRGVLVLAKAFRDAGMEVLYAGLLPTPEKVARIAVDEDVDVVALSLHNNAHLTAFPEVKRWLEKLGASDIQVVGGGIIPPEDREKLEKMGITGNFGPGTPLDVVIEHVKKAARKKWELESSGR
ncbi:MAG: cobalamin B12-binding domain-containing protein [Thermoplasmatales archaeon]